MVVPRKAPRGADRQIQADLDTAEAILAALDGAGEIELSMLAANAEGKIIIFDAQQVAKAVAMSGDATIASSGAIAIGNNKITNAMMTDDAIKAAELKIVERDITIANGAQSGTVTEEADIGGVILGVYPQQNIETAILDVSGPSAANGAIQVTLGAQQAQNDGHVSVIVLQA